jgi:ABC-type dipeptide/oligopeptide/nickel transport system permease subunit
MSFELFGSYFPAWVLCLVAGIFGVTLVHILLRKTGMLAAMPLLPIFYLLTLVFVGMSTWLLFFSAG